jgi:hypothetical protein
MDDVGSEKTLRRVPGGEGWTDCVGFWDTLCFCFLGAGWGYYPTWGAWAFAAGVGGLILSQGWSQWVTGALGDEVRRLREAWARESAERDQLRRRLDQLQTTYTRDELVLRGILGWVVQRYGEPTEDGKNRSVAVPKRDCCALPPGDVEVLYHDVDRTYRVWVSSGEPG